MPPAASPPCQVLVAFDKFKGALGAREACDVAAQVIARERPGWRIDLAPLTDGGDGFCSITTRAAAGELHLHCASGPLVDPSGVVARVEAPIGIVEVARLPARARELLDLPDSVRRLGVVEMASVSGLALVPVERRDVWRSSSRGTGELLLEAARAGVDAILLGVGGSATSDLGLGALAALGLRFQNANGNDVAPPVPARWSEVTRITGRVTPLPPLRIACDVDNPLLGERGAAAVYGPQKGLKPIDLPAFEASARRIAELLCAVLGTGRAPLEAPGAGAAGGIAFGLLVAAGARLVPGSRLIDAWLGLEARVRAADWVLTGEGRFDGSSASGKGPGAVVDLARQRGRPCAIFAGSIGDDVSAASARGDPLELIAISARGEPLADALAHTRENLARAIRAWLVRIESP